MWDHIDRIVAQWRKERPDIDVSPMMVMARITRFSKLYGKEMEGLFRRFGITREGFDVLATLRRSGPPYRLSPSNLFRWLLVASGTMTNRIDRLEQAGLVERLPDPNDRRGLLVALTPAGCAALDEAQVADLSLERKLLSVFTPEELDQLADLLRRLLQSVDPPAE